MLAGTLQVQGIQASDRIVVVLSMANIPKYLFARFLNSFL